MTELLCLICVLALLAGASCAGLPGFTQAPRFSEQVSLTTVLDGVRVAVGAPTGFAPERPTLVVFYATPNGNSLEQALGRRPRSPEEWRFDIQHVAAQVRKLREVRPGENTVLVCVQSPELSWPTWRVKHADAGALVRQLVQDTVATLPGEDKQVALLGHSGGGAFLLGFIEAGAEIPARVERIGFLDANYSYSEDKGHGDRLLSWLAGEPAHRLVVIAYDDRSVTLDGKPIVSADGGTYRATQRMMDRLAKDRPLSHSLHLDFDLYTDASRQAVFYVNRNYANSILHTALVGEHNGVLQALTVGTAEETAWGVFGGGRAYTRWIEPADEAVAPAGIPPRPVDAPGGAAVMSNLATLSGPEREAEMLAQITSGNVPDFLRCFRRVTVEGKDAAGAAHTVALDVIPDYLSVGSDDDFCRLPMTAAAAQRIADAFGCLLPTARIVDEIYRAAEAKLPPRPLTHEREAVTVFVQHNTIIQEQRAAIPNGPIVAGIKKDIVLTNRLRERAGRVAIYGWHRPDGRPIQPLTTVHVSTYVDYSHGVRLVSRRALLDGRECDLAELLGDTDLAPLLSGEGPLTVLGY